MIIQNLYKIIILVIIKTNTKQLLVPCFVLYLVVFSTNVFPQDSPDVSQNSENINFQEFFFKAITHKAINNFQKAIENLEVCNALKTNNKAVLFELSKNYYKLGRFTEAITYAEEALAVAPNNLWISEHLIQAYKSNNDFKNAITIQKKVITKYPKKKRNLVFLYLQTNYTDSAKIVLNELESTKLLTPKLRRIQENLRTYQNVRKQNKPLPATTSKTKNSNVEAQFKKDKSFTTLKRLLSKLHTNNNSKLLDYSEQGILLFPAQPFVYLMNAKAHNKNKNYKKALMSLQNGIDFVIDNHSMQANFYHEFIVSYKGLGDFKNSSNYQKKLQK